MNLYLLRQYYTEDEIKRLKPRSQADVDVHLLAVQGATKCQKEQWIKNIVAIKRDVARERRTRKNTE